ncbi:hypothetical protein DC498_17830 [Terrimonas sp.]|uniref:DUF1624 domain-containing protein n=1 Tax=Terrimonas sp. TaxID=1914338 RepID=UPI000D50B76A|nr:heparan-alpha-glucosaminide N-acetyltransferase domain-containing protein [Terrimonas sp.]PVD50829.1 hypothetical protein DC498_17830 [Terrimonas sp.]
MQPTLTAERKRITSIDLLRGLVMIIMALDHTRDFFHKEAFTGDPLDLANTSAFLFFTRWITHFCAPVFVFLSGMSAWLLGMRKPKGELCRFLISRGAWLILIEVFVVTFGITGDIHYGFIVLQVIWAIGVSMIILGLAIWLPYNLLLALGIVIVCGHNLLDFAEKNAGTDLPFWWYLLHKQTVVPLWNNHLLGVFYPLLPWIGLMMLGYCSGKIFAAFDLKKRNTVLLGAGIGILVFFIALRFINVYGDPVPWTVQSNNLFTLLSFVNVQKYPPSLLYLCLTIGAAFIFLALAKTNGWLSRIIIVFGRVPFFYYIIHFYLLHALSFIAYLLRGHSLAEGMAGVPELPFKFIKPGEGFSLPGVYITWILVVIILYPLCKWYDHYKNKHKEKWWLSYL